jgi:hypothetical protein
MSVTPTARLAATLIAAVALLSGCGSGSNEPADGATPAAPSAIAAETASFDLAAGVDQRYLLGLFATEGGSIIDGTITLDFETVDDGDPMTIDDVKATYVPVAGFDQRSPSDTPHVAEPGEGTGAYQADAVTFSRPGNWQVTATVDIDGETVRTTDAFEVLTERIVPGPGDPAPRSTNRLPGEAGVEPTAIDSRAVDGQVPDPELHAITVADSIDSGRPTMVVVSTPTYCVSRFCGPITDTIDELRESYSEWVNFVHLEVWDDYEASVVTKAAAEWIFPDGPDGGGGNEPWVFLIDRTGVITQRWDNVTNETQLRAALDTLDTPS